MQKFRIKFGKERRKHIATVCHTLAIGFAGPVIVQAMNQPSEVGFGKVLIVLTIFAILEITAVAVIKDEEEK